MCDDAVWEETFFLQFPSDWFETQEQLELRHDYGDYYNDQLNKWHESYQKRKAQKAKIKT